MDIIGKAHERYVFERRIDVLSERLASLLPEAASVLDVGCGDGRIDALIGQRRPDTSLRGIDVLVRPTTFIPVAAFDGRRIPFDDDSFDVVMFVDVLHHTDDPEALLLEARRVSRKAIVIKDHCRDGLLAGSTLRVMDWVGNARHGVVLPYNYWPERRWREAFGRLGLAIEDWIAGLGLYPWPFSMLLDRRLHFMARLSASGREGAAISTGKVA